MTKSAKGRTLLEAQGGALVIMLAFLGASAILASGVARSVVIEWAMAEHDLSRLSARAAAEAGLQAALRAREWSATSSWRASGVLPEGGEWSATVTLISARLNPMDGVPEWVFEIRSTGRSATAISGLSQGFSVFGGLPGTPRLSWWHQLELSP